MTDAQKALEMIRRARANGRASETVLTKPGSGGTYNPDTGMYEGGTPAATYTAWGVKVGYEQTDVDGTMVQRGDQRVYVAALGFVRPETNEQITVGGKVCTVVAVEVVAPGDEDVLYILQVRGL